MKRKLALVGLVVAIFVFSIIAVQPVKAERPDIVEIYKSSTPDDRIDVDSRGLVSWKLRWLSNRTEIVSGIIMIRVDGMDVDGLIYVNYGFDAWWMEYTSSEVIQLEFSVFCVYCSGISEFEQTAENVTIVWDSLDATVTDGTIIEDESENVKESVIDGTIPLIRIILLVVIIGEVCVIIILIMTIKRDR